ncbi:MAG: D-alanyl-lipoteichoic acid biosynthesis protein DltD [Anaerovoracaceae bacterium]
MRKLASSIAAVLIFLGFLTGIHFYALQSFPVTDRSVGYWLSTEKDASYILLEENIGRDTSLILGSSELRRFKGSRANPANLFNREGINTMIVGSAVNQSLNHAVLMAAIGSKLQSGKVVLILSPTWFYSHRDSASRYGMRLSRAFFRPAMRNGKLSESTKEEIKSLFRGDSLPNGFLENEKDLGRTAYAWFTSGRKKTVEISESVSSDPIDFERLISKTALTESRKIDKEFNMYSKSKIMNPAIIAGSRLKNSKYDFEGSKEYDYLKLFIRVCKEQGIEPVLVLQPINGRWYDYTGINADRRKHCYDSIRQIAQDNDIVLEDLSGYEYSEGFFCDAVHPSKKGWLIINEKIYKHIS